MDKNKWNNLVIEAGGDFMQSWEWGMFYTALGRRVKHIQAGGLAAQTIFRPLPLGRREAYVPMGPLVVDIPQSAEFWVAVSGISTRRTLFFECDLKEPISFLTPTGEDTRQPRQVHIVTIAEKNERTLYEQFHSTLQQNLDRAVRHDLVVAKEAGWEEFFALYQHTMRRHDLRPWHKEYIRTLFEVLSPVGQTEIWGVRHKGELLAANLYTLFNGRATHMFAGSSSRKRDYQAPHLLHWQMMSEFAKRGIKEYDLGKVDKKKLRGLTAFKERFGGTTHTYPGNYKKVLRPVQYRLYKAARSWIR